MAAGVWSEAMPVRNFNLAVSLIAATLITPSLSTPAHAAERRAIAVAPGPLDRAIAVLAQQAGVDIGSAEPGLSQVMTRGVKGRLTAAAALDQMLAGSPYTAQRLGGGSFRIVRRAVVRQPVAREHQPEPRRPLTPPPVEVSPEIIVTATKRATSRLRFPGALTILRPASTVSIRNDAANGMDEAIAATPILQSTALGAGRNKLFIRGVADSSFTGPTQSTANVYFGEVPVAYNGPEPGLNLYDVDQVEVLEGPQGTLYGAGAIGGIVRLVPHAVDLSGVSANVSGGVSATKSGDPGGDIAGMVNIPIETGVAGVRAVGYRVVEGGYIDDIRRGLRNVNRVATTGGRLDVRVVPASGWTVDAGVVIQDLTAPDLQYAERGMGSLSRASLLAQPFSQQYFLGRVVVDRRWEDGLHLVSATGFVHRDAESRFDATRPIRPDAPIAYDTDERSRLFSHETRISRAKPNGAGWLVGVALIHARDAYARKYGAPDKLRDIVGVTNRTLNAAVFGEAGIAISPALTITAGARLTHQRTDGDPIAKLKTTTYIRGLSSTRLDPTLGVSWLLTPTLAAYARYQSGFRTGGITVAPGVGRVTDLVRDTIHVGEIGLRKERHGPLGLSASIGASLTDWRHIQADLVDKSGFPFTTNLGNSHIYGLEASANWVPLSGLKIDMAMFLNDTRVADPDPAFRRQVGARLPNTPPFAVSGSVGYEWSLSADTHVSIDAGWRYVGRSTVGTQAPLDVSQGEYGSTHLGGTWTRNTIRLTATVENVFDVKGDRFAGGNPFALAARNEYTPLRPRTFRLGGAIGW
ncbi:outer membrane receptor protein involved in Fe transport [Sphingomonas sp. PP-CE-1A-559]|uniref:TonB-dependent receptor domain-containing protein n=1 Tax=Sphingomonas sp. PP-CE-1A-559 TaxID=2135657 RepID=UPI0010557ED8|nr:TonB-dependent receptor [Sphingomonas sp. PP-CE-1A-559]TCP93070.1 outer membrane receptor protein involved in Fe transport [Sphingomonas sp. PP-CE-1A-559]